MGPTEVEKCFRELVCIYKADPENFTEKYGIKSKSDGKHIIFDYDMIEANWNFMPTYLCRGLVVDASNFKPLSFPLLKFWNSGESAASTIDWASAKVYEKLDGSMVSRWFSPHTNKFEYSTRYQLPSDLRNNKIGDTGFTWEELIHKCMGDLPETIEQGKDETTVWEVMSPVNKVVVSHKSFTASLLARRNNITYKETDIHSSPLSPKTFSFSSASETEKFAESLKGYEQEGFVVVDKYFNRVKIKGGEYVRLHHLKDSSTKSMKALIIVVRNNEDSEMLTYFPEFKASVEKIRELIDDVTKQHEALWEKAKGIDSQKDFAIYISKEKGINTSVLFHTRSGRASSIKDAIAKMDDSQYLRFIKPLVEEAGIGLIMENDQ